MDEARSALNALKRYWSNHAEAIYHLPFPKREKTNTGNLPPNLIEIELPTWSNSGVNRKILVPRHLVQNLKLSPNTWKKTPWLNIIFWYLHCLPERQFEKQLGPIHSYSVKLKNWNPLMWQRAWVNRIALFLREWLLRKEEISERKIPLPDPEIIMTFDVDAVYKTLPLRLKGSAFACFNTIRSLRNRKIKDALISGKKALRFLFKQDKYDFLDETFDALEKNKIKGRYHFHTSKETTSFKSWLFDPGYLLSQISKDFLKQDKIEIGIHPSYDSWNDTKAYSKQIGKLQKITGQNIGYCRQHWLRFSWEHTWLSQIMADIKTDATLGFNDRSGFRNSSCLFFNPMNPDGNKLLTIESQPLVLMDSHLYDYTPQDEENRTKEITYWINEIKETKGQATVLWHPHTLSCDFGWKKGFYELTEILAK